MQFRELSLWVSSKGVRWEEMNQFPPLTVNSHDDLKELTGYG